MEMLGFYIWKFFTGLTILLAIPLGTLLVLVVMNQGKYGWREMNKDKSEMERVKDEWRMWK